MTWMQLLHATYDCTAVLIGQDTLEKEILQVKKIRIFSYNMFFSRKGTFEVYKHLSVILNTSYKEDFERNTFIYKEQILRPAYDDVLSNHYKPEAQAALLNASSQAVFLFLALCDDRRGKYP